MGTLCLTLCWGSGELSQEWGISTPPNRKKCFLERVLVGIVFAMGMAVPVSDPGCAGAAA